VEDVINKEGLIISEENKVSEVREWLRGKTNQLANYFIIVSKEGVFSGIISSSNLFSEQHDQNKQVSSLIKRKSVWIHLQDSLKTVVETMVTENVDLLPVVNDNQVVIGVISYKDILRAYSMSMTQHHKGNPAISLKRQTLKLLSRGQKLITITKDK
jgi:predicted transcriptional regulator